MKKHWKKILSLGLSLLMLLGQPFCFSFKNSGFSGISYGAERTDLVSATSLLPTKAYGIRYVLREPRVRRRQDMFREAISLFPPPPTPAIRILKPT